jgi:hypothetical protein
MLLTASHAAEGFAGVAEHVSILDMVAASIVAKTSKTVLEAAVCGGDVNHTLRIIGYPIANTRVTE